MSELNPDRLALARRRRGLSKSELAVRSSTSLRSITAFESGRAAPAADRLQLIAAALNFPVEFFYRGSPRMFSAENASFRSLKRMTASQRDQVLGAGTIAVELDHWIEQRFRRPAVNVPDMRGLQPEDAAMALRASWGLGQQAIVNMIHLLESNGVRVYSLDYNAVEIDAFSLWDGNSPFVFLNTHKSAERSRFDAAHELGHLVMHRHAPPGGKTAEEQAQAFAGAFLMPRAGLIATAPRIASLERIIQAKIGWGVSAMALIFRLREVGLVSAWHAQQLYIRVSSQYGRSEPATIDRECSQVLAKVFEMLRQDGISRSAIARQLSIPTLEIDAVTFGLTTLSVSPGTNRSEPAALGRPTLRLLED